jgi:hypothetical protein
VTAYLTIPEFKLRTIMPSEQIDRIETLQPGWLDAQLESSSRWVDMRVGKRYRVPFSAPFPESVRSWVARMVTARAYQHHGIPASDAQITLVTTDADKAETEVKEAADGQLGLVDLAQGDALRGVSLGTPHSYSESSPYVGRDVQRQRARSEDRNRRGT